MKPFQIDTFFHPFPNSRIKIQGIKKAETRSAFTLLCSFYLEFKDKLY